MDVPIYECFLGALASTEEIFIKEAGEHCRRDIDPYRYSMQLNKTKACLRTNINIPPSQYDEKLASTSTSTVPSIESTLSNSETEYEYYEENHLSINGNGNGNILTSTDSKVHISEKNSDVDELFHPIHPKLVVEIPSKTENNTTTQNIGNALANGRILIINVLPLILILPILIY